jgi:hypothetical protein
MIGVFLAEEKEENYYFICTPVNYRNLIIKISV